MVEPSLEQFAPAPLVSLINDAAHWVDVILAVMLTISCALVVVAVLSTSVRKRWLWAAGIVAFCGFISDEFVYRYYWDGMCAHSGYYQDGVRKPDVPKIRAARERGIVSAFAWVEFLEIRRFSIKDSPYAEIELVYYGSRWRRYLLHKPFSFLGGPGVVLTCSQQYNGK